MLEHDSQTCMCWSTIPRPVCAGPIQTRSPICFSIFTSHLVFQNFCDGHKKSHGSRSITEYAKSSTACRNYLTSPILHKHVTPCFFLNLLFSFKKLNNCMRWGTLLYTCMRWGTLLLRVCAGARCSYAYALGHAAPRRMRCGTLLLLVCVGARFSQTYALGHDAPRRMRWGTLFRGVCVGARCF